MNTRHIEKAQACLLGVAIGDAMGMPVETLTRAEIKERTGGTGITGFVAPLSGRKWAVPFGIGDTTDDWQLTSVVASSLIRTGILDMDDMATEHVRALEQSTFGWGRTTQRAIEEIRDRQRDAKAPAPSYGPKTGQGNGVIMKIAPLALRHAMTKRQLPAELFMNVARLGQLTHSDQRASISAYCVAKLMAGVFHHPCKTRRDVRRLLSPILGEIQLDYIDEQTESTSQRLWKLDDEAVTESSEALEAAVGCGFHCLDTMAFTIGTFMRHPTDFRAGVLEAVNAGGDTDSNASIVGALIGINCGLDAIPKEWMTFNPKFKEALELGRQLCPEE